jgi:plastocyanin
MRRLVQVAGAVLVTAAWSCGGSSNPTTPTLSVSGGGAGGATTIAVFGNDDQAFRPSQATVPPGTAVVWANADSTPHEVVATDGSFDTGVLATGAFSAPIVLQTDGANYYCKVHPTEHGAINGSNGAPPPCNGPNCG